MFFQVAMPGADWSTKACTAARNAVRPSGFLTSQRSATGSSAKWCSRNVSEFVDCCNLAQKGSSSAYTEMDSPNQLNGLVFSPGARVPTKLPASVTGLDCVLIAKATCRSVL